MYAKDTRQTLREVPGDIITLFQEAELLAVSYMEPISQCALQVYLTAISFSLEKSVIYGTFKHQSLGTVTTRPDLSDYIGPLRRGIDLHNPIYSVVFSPSGDSIATAGAKQGVQVWNTLTGGNVASLGDCSSTSLLVRFSPSGAYLAAAFESGTVAIWDPKVGREHLKHEDCHSEQITCLEFSSNSTLLASGARDRAIQVWSVDIAQSLYRLTTHEGPVTSLVFSSDSQRLFSGSEDNLIIIWDMSTGKVVRGMMGHRKAVNCVAVSQDGRILASGSEDKTIKIWNTSSGKCTDTFSKGHHTGIQSVHFFDEDKRLVAACDEAIISWDITSRSKSQIIWAVGQMLKTMLQNVPERKAKVLGWAAPKTLMRHIVRHGYDDQVSQEHVIIACASLSPSFAFAHKGSVYSGSLFSPMNNAPLIDTGIINGVSISSDGLLGATADPQGSLKILDLTIRHTWEEVGRRAKLDVLDNILWIVPSPNGKRFILNAMWHWYLTNDDYQILKEIDVGVIGSMLGNEDNRFMFSADGSILFCILSSLFNDDKSTLRVFRASTGEQCNQFTGLKKVHSLVTSVDGAWIACGHGSGKVDVFKVVGGDRKSMSVSDDSLVNALVFSDDAQSLVGGSKSGVVRIWDRASGECKATFEETTSTVTALAYGAEARVAIGREDGSLCLWSLSTSASHDIVRSDHATVKNVDFLQFSGDRTRLTSRGEDGTVFTWALPDSDDTEMAHCTHCLPQDDASNTGSLPHLLSQSDPEDAVDSLFHTAYRIRKDGWLLDGDRRVAWIPASIRPHGKNTFYAFESGLVVFLMPDSLWLFLKYVPPQD